MPVRSRPCRRWLGTADHDRSPPQGMPESRLHLPSQHLPVVGSCPRLCLAGRKGPTGAGSFYQIGRRVLLDGMVSGKSEPAALETAERPEAILFAVQR